jgi:S1-C subfamily serine protease
VKPGSAAALAGIRSGEVISHVGRKPVASVATLESALAAVGEGERVVLRVHDGRSARYVSLRTK